MTKYTGKRKDVKKSFNTTNKQGAPAARRDYIETEYVEGVFDKDGRQVIRPLNDKEKAFLEKFYKEEVHANFNNTPETISETKKLKDMRKNLEGHLKEHGVEHPDVLVQKKLVAKLKKKAGNMISDPDEQSRIYEDNYSRNHCVFNKAKASGNLWTYDWNESSNEKENIEEENIQNELENFGDDD